jgi:hypothetical protein
LQLRDGGKVPTKDLLPAVRRGIEACARAELDLIGGVS